MAEQRQDVDHETVVAYMRGWNEWRPECSCGWVGSYRSSQRTAGLEAMVHLDEQIDPAE